MQIKQKGKSTASERAFTLLAALFVTAILLFGGQVLALFGDVVGQHATAESGYLCAQAVLKIDDQTGDLMNAPTSIDSTCPPAQHLQVNLPDPNPNCDDLLCNGQYQGETRTVVQPNTIQKFSYTLTNVGTVDYQNYTGNRIAAWLDAAYLPVSYLTFSGTQYINSGISQTTTNIGVVADYQYSSMLSGQTSSVLFGARGAGAVNQALMAIANYSPSQMLYQFGSASTQIGNATPNTNRNTLTVSNNGRTATLGSGQTVTATAATLTTPYDIFIGAGNQAGTAIAGQYFVGNIYSFRIISSGNLLRDFIPAIDTETGECGLYDKVTKQFLGNAGTGVITCPTPTAADPNSPSLLLYPASVSNATINAELVQLQAGGISPSAIANINGSSCGDLFYGTDAGVISCMTSTLGGTLNQFYAVGSSQTYNYKFVLHAPNNTSSIYSSAKIYLGVSSGAQGTLATNWKQQLHPYISTVVPIGNVPILVDAGHNKHPFLDQVANNPVAINDYLLGLIIATDIEDGNLTNQVEILDDGGFDPSRVGQYEISYRVEDSDGNIVTLALTVEVWNFVKIASGMYHGIALGSEGSVWTWGYNSDGQRGQGNTNGAATMRAPTQVAQSALGNLPAIDIAGSNNTSCAVNSAGTAYCWGDGSNGALGNGSSSDVSSPTPVTMPNGIIFTQIAGAQGAGTNGFFAALGSDGNVYTWGYGGGYRLGTGSTSNVTVPTKITTTGDVVQISQGASSGSAVTMSGQVYVWGMNGYGQLALGNTTASNATTSTPHIVNGLPGSVVQVSTGGYSNYGFTLAITAAGDVWAWGWTYGVNGNSGGNKTTPVQVPVVSGVRQVNAAADFANYVVGNNVYSLGYANYGETFLGTISTTSTPTISPLINVAGNVGMVAGGYDNAWILSADGKTVYGIGYCNALGQEFGSTSVQTTSTSSVVPWSFTPPTL